MPVELGGRNPFAASSEADAHAQRQAMSGPQEQASATSVQGQAAVNLAQLDTLVRQYMVVEDIVEVRRSVPFLDLLHQRLRFVQYWNPAPWRWTDIESEYRRATTLLTAMSAARRGGSARRCGKRFSMRMCRRACVLLTPWTPVCCRHVSLTLKYRITLSLLNLLWIMVTSILHTRQTQPHRRPQDTSEV